MIVLLVLLMHMSNHLIYRNLTLVLKSWGLIDGKLIAIDGTRIKAQIIPKRTRDVSGIEDKILAMYTKGVSQRDIADTIEDVYGFEIFHETISEITDHVLLPFLPNVKPRNLKFQIANNL